ncbi:unannotated protein [freshwater metagenome]|uniref:Unannotated protein n=1 Tax=freshwater metagenome TaxID=449393 RepID=A0A6J7DQZ5_9ZZZZ
MSSPAPYRARVPYQPALDGVRSVAVVMVLLFHGGVSWMGGGYFGVSVFFTLSGFLITSLLYREFDSTRRIGPAAFYARRAKRLLPASVVCLSAVSVMAANSAWNGVDHLKRDLLSAVGQVANWVRLFAGESYIDVQSKTAGMRSPLDHYWSLAIEEQFYWIWPLAFWALARWARRRSWSMTRVVGACTLVSAVCAPVIAATWGSDAAYWATPARACEILLGALIAVALAERRLSAAAWMAPAGLVAVVVLAIVLPTASGPAYSGALPLLALASGTLLLGLQRPGPVTAMLSWRPFVALGRVSYGVYLYHLPVFVFVTEARAGIGGWALLGLRLGITLAVAVASYWLIERPVRQAAWSGVRTAFIAAGACVLVAVLGSAVPIASANYWTVSEAAGAQAAIPTGGSVAALLPTPAGSPGDGSVPVSSGVVVAPTDTSIVLPALNRPVRILLVGDSTAEATGSGLVAWATQHPSVAQVTVAASPGCGFIRGGTVATDNGTPFQAACNDVLDKQVPAQLRDLHPDVVVLMVYARDTSPREWDAGEGELTADDPRFVERMVGDFAALQTMILDTSTAQVMWVRPLHADPYWAHVVSAITEDATHAIIDDATRTVASLGNGRAQVIDLRAWAERDGVAFDHVARPDGVHFTTAAATDVSERWFGPQLVLAATRAATTTAGP